MRRGVITNPWAIPHCYVPVKRVRNLLKFLGCPDLDAPSRKYELSKPIHSFLEEHLCQLAAYSKGTIGELRRGAICFVSVTVPGFSKVVEASAEDLKRGWDMFVALLSLWKIKNRCDTAF